MLINSTLRWKLLGLITVLVIAASVIVIFVVLHPFAVTEELSPPDVTKPLPPSSSKLGKYSRAAVVANGEPCSKMAKAILMAGGNAVDAMITTMLCDGVTMPMMSGIGGGFFMIVYNRTERRAYSINARETAPGAATQDMYVHNPNTSTTGGLAIAVPGEIRGYIAIKEKFGGPIPWRDLILPVAELCRNGIPVNKILEHRVRVVEDDVRNRKGLKELFVKSNGELVQYGDKYKNIKLADTLVKIAEEGGHIFYNGTLADSIVKDIEANGGIISKEDLANYEVRIEDPIETTTFDDFKLHTLPPPSSGVILNYILQLVKNMVPASSDILNTQRITEAFKYAYAARSRLGDPYFTDITQVMSEIMSQYHINRTRKAINDNHTWNDVSHYGGSYLQSNDHGTCSMGIVSENGDAVAATTSLNHLFGSKVISETTGIIFNNQMDDFSSPHIINGFGVRPSEANFIAPGKRPLSSMSPSVITDSNGDVKMVIGAAGGTLITTSVALTTIRTLVFNKNIKEAIDEPMFHHQLLPMEWQYWYGTLKSTVDGMKERGHKVNRVEDSLYACINAIHKENLTLYTNTDYRRPGTEDGY